jgi:hypothetical protein
MLDPSMDFNNRWQARAMSAEVEVQGERDMNCNPFHIQPRSNRRRARVASFSTSALKSAISFSPCQNQ